MRGPISVAIYSLSFFIYNLIASGDYRHLSLSFCNESLPRINFVILFSSFSPSKPFPNLIHSLIIKISSSAGSNTKFCQARPKTLPLSSGFSGSSKLCGKLIKYIRFSRGKKTSTFARPVYMSEWIRRTTLVSEKKLGSKIKWGRIILLINMYNLSLIHI